MNSVSVVTVVLNDAANIETTIQSVLSQENCSIEYIIVDGGSTDGTIEIIEKYRSRLAHVSSGKDAGIYDAMNRGIRVATRMWTIFMNSGDCFVSTHVISKAMSDARQSDDVLYGGYLVNYGAQAARLVCPGEMQDLWKKPITSHQAIFVRTELMKAHQFDLHFSLAADHALMSKLYSLGCTFRCVPYTIACVSAAGISDVRRARVFREFSEIAKTFSPQKPYRLYFFIRTLDGWLRTFVKTFIPQSLRLRLQLRGRKQECR